MSVIHLRRVLAPSAVFLLACCFAFSARLFAQTEAPPVPSAENAASGQPRFLELEHTAPGQLDPADAARLHAQARAIAGEAAFFGYNLHASGWTWNEAVCPVFPDHLLLHYQRTAPDGGVSLFTALVPRRASAHRVSSSDQDRVYVVPILYRGATPFQSAEGSERSIAVFNRVVPADVAAQALQPDGHWLVLSLCYADMVGAEAHAVQRAGGDLALALAPLPTLHIAEGGPTSEVVFTDRSTPHHYLVWTLTFTDKGRLRAASAQSLSDYVAPFRHGKEPLVRVLPPGQEPKVKVLPPGQEPSVKTVPQ